MTRRKATIISVTVLATAAAALVGVSIYPETDLFRQQMEQVLSDRLNMNVSIERILHDAKCRVLHNVLATARHRDVDIFRCERAEWTDLVDESKTTRSLKIINGMMLVGEDEWQREDYKQVLESGLGHDFSEMGLTGIHIDNIDLEWRHPQFTFTADDTTGQIDFDDNNTANAVLTAPILNGSTVPDPIRITANFTPGQPVEFHHVTLDIAQLPLSSLGIDTFVESEVTTGQFRGSVVYRKTENTTIQIHGNIENAQLHELTAALPHGPYHGKVDLTVDNIEIQNNELDKLHIAGSVDGLHLKHVTTALHLPNIDGTIDLKVHDAIVENKQLKHLNATGFAEKLSLDILTSILGKGKITGSLNVALNALEIVDGEVASAKIVLTAIPPDDAPGTIDRDVLKYLSEQALGVVVASVVPIVVDSVEYTHLGAELELVGDRLYVRGSHGPERNRILSIKVLGAEIPAVTAPQEFYNVHELLEKFRQKIADTDREKIKHWWQKHADVDETD